ncbi:MAG: hypothetical protein H6876_10440 [Hyphomicrobiaceae bacterium]|nr:hypothetical protein [Hyphomicrobiaceae bacterium]
MRSFPVFTLASRWRRGALFAVLAGALAVSGCAGEGASGGSGPGAVARDNASCRDARRELDQLDARGVPNLIEASNNGKKLSAKQQGEVDRYNRLLEIYLGSRCHL